MDFLSEPSERIQGTIQVPGDKSISHRSVMFGAIASGDTKVLGFLEGEDCLATINAFKHMGVNIENKGSGELLIHGVGKTGLIEPQLPLDLGNSGTSIRLLTGLLAGQNFQKVCMTGDESLKKRPMKRVVDPLQKMQVKIDTLDGCPPLTVHCNPNLKAVEYTCPMASAQVKSCVLLAGLYAKGVTKVIEPGITRDHTERMLAGFGVNLSTQHRTISIQGGQTLKGTEIKVPADISSAAFFMVAASIVPDSELLLKQVGINPTRIGVLKILKAMGADITLHNQSQVCGEPVADILVKHAKLKGIQIPEDLVPLAIDEFPVLFIAAACAEGATELKGAKELRVKESDRIASMAKGLKILGIQCQELEDGIIIEGGEFSGGKVHSFADHRIAMAFSVAGLVAEDAVRIIDCDNVNTSFPNFAEVFNHLGGNIEVIES